MDAWLKKRYEKYIEWLDSGRIDYTSKILPVRESVSDTQWILPTQQVVDIIRNANFIALTDCVCRTHYQRCDKPVDVCLLLDEVGRAYVDKGVAREIDREKAVSILKVANEKGLVHLSLYQPDHQLYALCSCCACCCHDLQVLIKFGQDRLVCHADCIVGTNENECTHCGDCEERCVFGARKIQDGEMIFNSDLCYGCGLCVATCPARAIEMELRNPNYPTKKNNGKVIIKQDEEF